MNVIQIEPFDSHKLYSKYWMDNLPEENIDIISLATYRRAVAKFVKISTLSAGVNKNIKVKFNVKDISYTAGDKVVLSAKIKNHEFDAVVGLALHESNHIIDTDPNANRRLLRPDQNDTLPLGDELYKHMKRLELGEYEIRSIANRYRNWIEDRRVDKRGWERSPGYKPYYTALYKKYFHSKLISIGLQSGLHREVSLEAYSFRIVNMINSNSDLDALPGLEAIHKLLDLDNIDRLNSNFDSAKLALEVLGLILSHFPDPEPEPESKKSNESKQKETGKGESGGGEEELPDDMVDEDMSNSGQSPVETEEDQSDSDESNGENDNSKEGSDGDDSEEKSDDKNSEDSDDKSKEESDDKDSKDSEEESKEEEKKEEEELPKLSDAQERNLKKEVKDQTDFIDGEVKKRSLNKNDEKLLDAIEKSDTTMEKVQGDNTTGMNVMVVRKLNKSILDSLPIGYRGVYKDSMKALQAGTKLGRMLARKLQIRNEVKVIKTKRKTAGKIDKRLLYNVGFGDTAIFEKTKIDEFGNALVHISIDASGSMSWSRWTPTMTAVIAIAYAASKVENLDVIISFRSTIDLSTRSRVRRYNEDVPLMVMAYDSRFESFKKIQTIFPHICPDGLTPEGLCYEAVMKDIMSSTAGKVGYFINFSDGGPNMINTKNPKADETPENIAKAMVDKMRNVGINILSFYIDKVADRRNKDFEYMYGKSAKTIDVTQLVPLAKELNKLFSTQKR